jgi:hypothetical protein
LDRVPEPAAFWQTRAMLERVRKDIEDLHVFFTKWFRGDIEKPHRAFAIELERRLDSGFTYIPPTGAWVERETLVARLHESRSSNPALEIEISEVRVTEHEAQLLAVTYIELQRGSVNYEATNARRCTVLMRLDESAPMGLRWMHLHETAVPLEST